MITLTGGQSVHGGLTGGGPGFLGGGGTRVGQSVQGGTGGGPGFVGGGGGVSK